MGINFSRAQATEEESLVDSTSRVMEQDNESEDEFQEALEEPRTAAQELVKFRQELAVKREQRRQILAKHSKEKENLRKCLVTQLQSNENLANENKMLRELLHQHGIEVPQSLQSETVDSEGPLSVLMEDLESLKEHNRKLHRDLAETNLALQSANADMASLHGQNLESRKQINALKEVVAVSKTMMQIRESQLNDLKTKLTQIESSLADREASLLSTDLRAEYERQLHNIRTLRTLYEERARLGEISRGQLARDLEEQRQITAVETARCQELTDKVAELEAKVADMSDTIDSKDDQISLTKEETRGLKAEMSTVNKLFSQMLLGYRSQQDLSKLVSRLEEHHGLLAHMVAKDGAEASSALPKLLLDLVSQVDQDKSEQTKDDETGLNTTAEEIVDNLPKVWRVLMELLSHQSSAEKGADEVHPATCYKPVETSSGTRMVPSVSQTYIRLKDLIVEKLSLTKEMAKMKQLNVHLESRLEEQERRLGLVTSELSKTWHVVGKLRRHHHQLHTHEKILRYELQQKRKMLNELKEELEFCKEKWDKAREKNCESEKEWTKLRSELSDRHKKLKQLSTNSVESGYSDERQSEDDSTESNDESESSNDAPVRCKKRIKKTHHIIQDPRIDENLVSEKEDVSTHSVDVSDLPLDELDEDEREDDLLTSESSVSDSFINKFTNNESNRRDETTFNENNFNSEVFPSSIENNFIDQETSHSSHENKNTKPKTDSTTSEDKKLEALEESSSSLLEQTLKVASLRQSIENKYPKLKQNDTTKQYIPKDLTTITPTSSVIEAEPNRDIVNISPDSIDIPGTSSAINPKEILESVKKQDERLSKREDRMKKLEESCDFLLQSSKNRIILGNNLERQINKICSEKSDVSNSDTSSETNRSNCELSMVSDGPSTSLQQNKSDQNDIVCFPSSSQITTSNNLIDPKEILENVKKQNEILAKRDERMNGLEEGCKELVNTSKNTNQVSDNIKARLNITLCDRVLEVQNKSIASETAGSSAEDIVKEDDADYENAQENIENTTKSTGHDDIDYIEDTIKDHLRCNYSVQSDTLAGNIDLPPSCSSKQDCVSEDSFCAKETNLIDAKEILENVRKQDERLAKREERMKRLEEECKSLVKTSKNTNLVSSNIEARLDIIHEKATEVQKIFDENAIIPENPETKVATSNDENNESKNANENEKPSTSATSMDHEARFAARDERFKRLEEQAKFLVDKVNDTTDKSVRITYKLEELHNIYGSEGESSRTQNIDETNDGDNSIHDDETE